MFVSPILNFLIIPEVSLPLLTALCMTLVLNVYVHV